MSENNSERPHFLPPHDGRYGPKDHLPPQDHASHDQGPSEDSDDGSGPAQQPFMPPQTSNHPEARHYRGDSSHAAGPATHQTRASGAPLNPHLPGSVPAPDWAPPAPDQSATVRERRNGPGPNSQRRIVIPNERPVVTYWLIGICVVVWLLELTVPGFFNLVVLTPSIGASQPLRFLTSAFAHSQGITHILFNMFALWVMGRSLEPIMGHARFLATYLVSALAGGVMFVLLASPQGLSWTTGIVGASGAVFGLFGAMAVIIKEARLNPSGLISILILNVVLTFIVPNIAWQGHLGGFLAGLAATWLFVRGRRERMQQKKDRSWAYYTVLVVVIIALVFVKYLTV